MRFWRRWDLETYSTPARTPSSMFQMASLGSPSRRGRRWCWRWRRRARTDKAGGGASSGQFTEALFNVVPGQGSHPSLSDRVGPECRTGYGSTTGVPHPATSAVELARHSRRRRKEELHRQRILGDRWRSDRGHHDPQQPHGGGCHRRNGGDEVTRPSTGASSSCLGCWWGESRPHGVTAGSASGSTAAAADSSDRPAVTAGAADLPRLEPPTATAAHSLGVMIRMRRTRIGWWN